MEEYHIRTIYELFCIRETAIPALCISTLFTSIGYIAGLAFSSGYWHYRTEKMKRDDEKKEQRKADRHQKKLDRLFTAYDLHIDPGDSGRIKDTAGRIYCESCLAVPGREHLTIMVPDPRKHKSGLFFCPRCGHSG